MKYAGILLPAYLLLTITTYAQGSSCSNAINIPLDGVIRTYATSSSTGTAVVCSYANSTPITWFSFTSNAQAECPLLNITAADGQPCEIALYTSCSGGNILQTPSSMCFDDGTGLWAPAETFSVTANHTYYLRIKTTTATNISISAQSYTPSNNLCSGAISIDGSGRKQNNACNKPSTEVLSSDLCAFTLENTAFYQYYVASDGVSVINISNISCDNGAANNSSGFQIGFFTGTCSSLTALYCTSGTGAFVQGTTPVLPAGTKVYVAVDGMSGSNCVFTITAFNAYSLMAANFKKFSAWQKGDINILQWNSSSDSSLLYQVERSVDGTHFEKIGTLTNTDPGSEQQEFKFEDLTPLSKSYYRIKQLDQKGKMSVSEVVLVKRKNIFTLTPLGSFTDNCSFRITCVEKGSVGYYIVNSLGQTVAQGIEYLNEGINLFSKNISNLPRGKYFISFSSKGEVFTRGFVRQ